MKNKLIIWLILSGCLGCSQTKQTTETQLSKTSINTSYDTTLAHEKLQQEYDKHISLAWKAKLKGNLVDVLGHMEKAIQVNDSIQKISNTEIIETKNTSSSLWLGLGGIFLTLSLATGSVMYYKRKRNVQQESSTNKLQQYQIAAFKQSELYQEILQAAQDESINLSPVSKPLKWISIQEHLDRLYPDFTQRLLAECPNLSETEQHICWLSKIGIPPSGIARILKLSRQAITNARSRIVKKKQKEGNPVIVFSHFIDSF